MVGELRRMGSSSCTTFGLMSGPRIRPMSLRVRAQFSGCHLHAERAVGERLGDGHVAPLALAVGMELRDAGLELLDIARGEEVFHAAILAKASGAWSAK